MEAENIENLKRNPKEKKLEKRSKK